MDRLTDAQGAESQAMSFGAWGDRRDPADWTGLAEATAASFDTCATTRGFTGHETLDAVGAVHMNGRLHDPTLGRFLRADPYVQFPANLQGHNRYGYALNNPLSFTDPSGHFVGPLLAFAARTVVAHLAHRHVLGQVPLLNAVAQVAACAYGGIGGCIDYAAHSAYAQTGSFRAALRAGTFAGVSAAAFSAVGVGPLGHAPGDGFGQLLANSAANGVLGGVLGELQGGSFGHGFLSAGVSALAKPAIRAAIGIEARGMPLRVAARAAVAGTISSATGGKFLNGAVTGAFSQLFNEERSRERKPRVRGRPLTDDEMAIFAKHFDAEVLESARVYDGRVPIWLRGKMVAVVRGNKIYIRSDHYTPGTAKGVMLLGHELVHVEQYREGMNVFTYLWKSRRGYKDNRYEVEAYNRAEVIRESFCASNPGAVGC